MEELRLKELLREEELKWALRAKVRRVVQGDANTQFFHMIANGKHRKKRIFQLEQDEGTILGPPTQETPQMPNLILPTLKRSLPS